MAVTGCGEGGIARPGTGGSPGSPGPANPLVGAWERTLILQEPDDIHLSETVWSFRADGTCERAVTSTSVSAGISDTQTSTCTYVLDRSRLSITFSGSTVPVVFTAVVTGDTLTLDDVEFQRV